LLRSLSRHALAFGAATPLLLAALLPA
jgi:hypothetical protein